MKCFSWKTLMRFMTISQCPIKLPIKVIGRLQVLRYIYNDFVIFSNKRKRTEPVVPATDVEMVQSPLKKSRAECNEKLNNLSLGGDT